jgi:hypothetical protein
MTGALDKEGLEASNLIAEAVEAQWGARCPEFDPDCHTCQAWKQLDDLATARPALTEGAMAALMEIRDRHLPDQPTHYGGTEYDWVVRQYDGLRHIARRAIDARGDA